MSEVLLTPPAPGTAEWARVLSASKVPAMLGLSPWQSQFTLWHEMRGDTEPDPFPEHLNRFGHLAELMLGPWWEQDSPGRTLGTHDVAYTNEKGWIATLDWEGEDEDGPCIIECKTARSLDEWADEDGEPAVPTHYLAQVLFQMGVSGIHRTYVVVLGPFHQVEIYPVEFDPDMWAPLETMADEWMASLDSGDEPDLDHSVSTYNTVRKLHPDIEKGEEVQIDQAQALAILDTQHTLDQLESDLRGHKTDALALMGCAQKLTCNGETIATRRPTRSGVALYINKKAEL